MPYDETPEIVQTKPQREIGPQLPPKYSNFVGAEKTCEESEYPKDSLESPSDKTCDGMPIELEIEQQSEVTEGETRDEGKPTPTETCSDRNEPVKRKKTSATDDLNKASKILENLEREFAKRSDSPEPVNVTVEKLDKYAEQVDAEDGDDVEFDIDDIDQQLDMALERKLVRILVENLNYTGITLK